VDRRQTGNRSTVNFAENGKAGGRGSNIYAPSSRSMASIPEADTTRKLNKPCARNLFV
jgi:hypothetical protein